MKPFEAEVPSFPTPAAAPLRTRDAAKLVEALAALAPPFEPALGAELIALALAHSDETVRKKATALATKHVPELAKFKAAYKSLAGQQPYVIDERVAAFEHPMRLDVAKALLFHRYGGAAVVFAEDPQLRSAMLDLIVDHAIREEETSLAIHTIYWHWRTSGGGMPSYVHLDALPAGLVDELEARRKRFAFDGLDFHGCELTTLPDELARTAPWLAKLTLAFNPFAKLPPVLWQLTNLTTLDLSGTQLVDIPADIARLTKLRHLDLGNMEKMKEVPASVCKLDTLESLRIGNGSISKIPDALVGMTALRELELQSTKVSKLPKGIEKMPNLKKVNLRWSKVPEATIAALEGAGITVEKD